MAGKIGGVFSVLMVAMLVATCGGGGSPTDPGLEQASAGQGDTGKGDPSDIGDGAGGGGGGGGQGGKVDRGDDGSGGQFGCPTPGNADKQLVCHIPPGNPNNARDLCIDQSAVSAHLAHGDYMGGCVECAPGDPYCVGPG